MKKNKLITLLIVSLIIFLQTEAKNSKVLIIADEWPQMEKLAEGLRRHGDYFIQKVEEDQINGDLTGYNFVVMYLHKTLKTTTEQNLINYTKNGGSLIVLHHGIASAKMQNPGWLNFLGIELFPRDHKEYPWRVLEHTTYTMVNLYPGHFITSNGINYEKVIDFKTEYPSIKKGEYQAFDLPDTEIFINQRFKKNDNKTILFGLSTENGSIMQPTSGWYKKVEKGIVFYYQAGHAPSDYANPNFLKVILNTLEWHPE